MPRTKHIESRMLDLPEPLRPVMELKDSSLRGVRRSVGRLLLFTYQPEITVRTAYDLKPYEIVRLIIWLTDKESAHL